MFDNSRSAVEYNDSVAAEINKLAEPLFKNFNITTFAHIKIFKDSLFHVTNNQQWLAFYCANKLFDSAHYQHEINNLSNHYFVLRNDKASLVKAMHNYAVWHGLCIYKKYDDYVEMWNFATTKENVEIYNFYLNNMHYLERFIVYFKNQAKDIIEQPKEKILLKRKQELILDNHSLSMSEAKRDFLIETKLKKLQFYGLKVNISKREIECLHLLAKGKMLKEIALILNISTRTIETHLNQLKVKLGCYYKNELVNFYDKNLKSYFISELEN